MDDITNKFCSMSISFNFVLKQQINYQVNNSSDFRKFPFDNISTSADFIFQDVDLSTSPRYNPEISMMEGNEILYEWEISPGSINKCRGTLFKALKIFLFVIPSDRNLDTISFLWP